MVAVLAVSTAIAACSGESGSGERSATTRARPSEATTARRKVHDVTFRAEGTTSSAVLHYARITEGFVALPVERHAFLVDGDQAVLEIDANAPGSAHCTILVDGVEVVSAEGQGTPLIAQCDAVIGRPTAQAVSP